MIVEVLSLVARAINKDGVEVPDEPTSSPYGYTPAFANCVAYVVVFSLLTIVHLVLAVKYKYYSAIVTMVFGGILEIIGWAGRLWSHKNVLLWDNFIMQICCLIIGPVFFSAWDYTLLGMCIKHLGAQYSMIGPNLYLIIFIIADIVSLVLQAIGGGGAALGTTTIFTVLAIDFMVRVMWHKPYPQRWVQGRSLCFRRKKGGKRDKRETEGEDHNSLSTVNDPELSPKGANHNRWLRKNQFLLLGVAWATLMIYIRGIYRSIELAEGWDGKVITTESYFVWLDGFIMVLCMAGLAVAHPGWLLPPRRWRD